MKPENLKIIARKKNLKEKKKKKKTKRNIFTSENPALLVQEWS